MMSNAASFVGEWQIECYAIWLKNCGSTLNRFRVVHSYISSALHVKDNEILSFLPAKSRTITQILYSKIKNTQWTTHR